MYTAQYMNGTIIETKLKRDIVDTFTILNGLHEYTNYTISVRARTAVGPGPFSSSIIMVLTNETCEYINALLLYEHFIINVDGNSYRVDYYLTMNSIIHFFHSSWYC